MNGMAAIAFRGAMINKIINNQRPVFWWSRANGAFCLL